MMVVLVPFLSRTRVHIRQSMHAVFVCMVRVLRCTQCFGRVRTRRPSVHAPDFLSNGCVYAKNVYCIERVDVRRREARILRQPVKAQAQAL